VAPTGCDNCKEEPIFNEVPEAKSVCPGDFSDPAPTDVNVTSVCGQDLTGTNVEMVPKCFTCRPICLTFLDYYFQLAIIIIGITMANQTKIMVEDTNQCAGTITNTWTVIQSECIALDRATATQIITIEDKEPPTFVDTVLPDLVYTCPSDYMEASLTTPMALDNCATEVNVTKQAANLSACEDLTITWVAADNCGHEAQLAQTVKIDDTIPPMIVGAAPSDVILTCSDDFPAAQNLTFHDNCAGNMTVMAEETNNGASVCDGNITTRVWEGPADTCGNKGADITQTITILDQSPPALPADMEDINMTCPSDFSTEKLVVPNATDDCSVPEAITVVPTATDVNGCNNVVVTWTATDECSKTFTTNQIVRLLQNVSIVLTKFGSLMFPLFFLIPKRRYLSQIMPPRPLSMELHPWM